MKNNLGKKQIPTLLGIGVLIVALVVGVVFLNQGLGVFAPRATAQTTPKKIKITNVHENAFTVSFLTDDSTVGFIKYGTDQSSLKSQAGDDRDQLSGSVSPYTTHYITVHDLQPNTTYYFTLGTGANSRFDNNGAPFTIKTAKAGGIPGAARTVYGNVNDEKGQPASGAIVYLAIDGAGEMSSLVKESGNWAIPLSSARSIDGSQYAQITDTTDMLISVQGASVTSTASQRVKVTEAQPVPTITLGTIGGAADITGTTNASNSASQTTQTTDSSNPFVDTTTTTDTTNSSASSASAFGAPNSSASSNASDNSIALNNLGGTDNLSSLNSSSSATASAQASPSATVVDMAKTDKPVVDTVQPIIIGHAAANITVKVQIHSNQVVNTQTTADSSGNYTVDLSSLQQNLAPGEHTITITYTDPQTGKTVTQTKTFTVQPQVALADTSSTSSSGSSSAPFGTGNPFSIDNSGASNSATPSASPKTSMPSTGSGLPKSGTVELTWLVLGAGLFFIIAGALTYRHALDTLQSEE